MMKNIYTKTALALIATAIMTTGCSQQEAALANTMLNAAGGAAGRATTGGSFNPASSLSSPAALSGMAQSQVVGAQMLANPALLGVGAVGTAISQYNQAQNRKAFEKVTDLYVNADGVNNKMEMMMVRQYNKQHGTHFKTMQELQDYAKVMGYNKREGTHFTTFSQVREDYNRKHHTDFKTDKAFKAYLASNR